MREAPAALDLAERACRATDGDEADALVHAESSGFARFAASAVHQPTLISNRSVTIRVVRDGRVGAVATNRTDAEGLRKAARRAAEAADRARPDPSFPGLGPPAPPADVEGFDAETATLSPQEQAALASAAVEAAPAYGVYGYVTTGAVELAVASTTGVAVSQTLSDASVLALAAREGESGFGQATSWRVGDLDPAAVARRAAETAARTRGAGRVEPGTYRALLAPPAVGELLSYFGAACLGGLAVLEGRSFLSGRLGERIFHPGFSLVDDPLDRRGLPKAFDLEGVPKRRVALVEGGVVRGAVWDRRTARRAATESTGHAVAATSQAFGPMAFNLAVPGGDATVEELAERVDRGLYVTRLHYVNVVDAREAILTGTTRDGTFLIEHGRVTSPVVNLRFTTSFAALASGLVGLTREQTLVNVDHFFGARYPHGALVPALATDAFTVVGTGSGPGL